MTATRTYQQTASDWSLWREFVDTDATMTREEFDALSVEAKIALQIEAFGVEPESEIAYAIDESILRDRIVYVPDTPANRGMLGSACDGSAEGDVLEYWGERDDGQEWRVHIRLA